MKFYLFVFVLTISASSCDQDKKVLSKEEKNLVGYWIPKKIDWFRPNSGDKKIDSIRRYANFPVLCFSSTQFDLINATNGYTLGDDSLVFESEPGIELFRGKWVVEDSLVFIDYQLKFSMFDPTGENTSLLKDTVRLVSKEAGLIFNGKAFIKTEQYDRQSIDKIEAYRASDEY